MSKRFTLVMSTVASLAALLMACSGGNDTTPAPGIEGEAQVSVQGLAAYEIQSMVVTAQPSNVSRVLSYSPETGTFTGTLVLPVGTQTLIANGYAYVAPDGGPVDGGPVDGGSFDAGTPWDAGASEDGGFPTDGGPSTDGGFPTDGGRDEPPPPPHLDGGYQEPVLTLVASGTATVEIVANTTAAVAMRIYDLTPPRPQPDIAPLIRSATVTSTSVSVNQLVSLSVDAVDLDGDPMTYAWTSDCASGVFTNPTGTVTDWGSPTPGACTLTVTVSSRGQSTSMSVNVTVFGNGGATGGAQVTGEYIPRPDIYSISAFYPEIPRYNSVYRYENTANLPTLRSGTMYRVEINVNYNTHLGTRTVDMQASCGSVARSYDSCFGITPPPSTCRVEYEWTTPVGGGVCRLTASATNDGLTDSFTVGALVR